jgi:hypothetical protein
MSFAHTLRRNAALIAGVGTLGAAAGCGSSHVPTPATAPHSPAAAWHQVVLCARAHGMPGLQDPRVDSTGEAIFPNGLDIPAETRRACQRLVDRLVPSAESQTPTPSQLAGLARFARCLRSHGIGDWPDPRPDGTFVPDARVSHLLKSSFRNQLMTCERFNPDAHGRVYFSQP